MKVAFKIPLPENLHEINDGEEELEIIAELPFRPNLMDLVVPGNLLYDAIGYPKGITDYFIEEIEFLVTEITILKDEEGSIFLECYCEPSGNFEMDEGMDFILGRN